jgi:hypothetical protein
MWLCEHILHRLDHLFSPFLHSLSDGRAYTFPAGALLTNETMTIASRHRPPIKGVRAVKVTVIP